MRLEPFSRATPAIEVPRLGAMEFPPACGTGIDQFRTRMNPLIHPAVNARAHTLRLAAKGRAVPRVAQVDHLVLERVIDIVGKTFVVRSG